MGESISDNAIDLSAEVRAGTKRGWAFTPLRGKKPIRPNWQSEPPLEADYLLDKYLEQGLDVGVRTGTTSGLLIVDVDEQKGGVIPEECPPTVAVRTGGGGLHLYYQLPDGTKIPNSAGQLAPHVDVRGEGGQCVFVGSLHESGEYYRWLVDHGPDEVDLTPLPQVIIDKLLPKTAMAHQVSGGNGRADSGTDAYVHAAFEEEVDAVRRTAQGSRNSRLNSASFSIGTLMHLGVLDDEEVEKKFLAAAAACGLGTEEATSTIKSGLKAGQAKPRNISLVSGTVIRNYALDPRNPQRRQPLGLGATTRNMLEITGGWPKRVGSTLFVEQQDDVRLLQSTDALFAYLGAQAPLHWRRGHAIDGALLTPKSEFYAHLQHSVECYEQVERLPHEPPVPNFYYIWTSPDHEPGNSGCFDELLEFFDNHETPTDKALIRAMFLTPLWGGLPGTRPAFAIMADDRGYGKSTLKDAVAELYGGISLEPNRGNEERIVTRLLSEGALTARVVSVDNIKGAFSSGLLEGLITATYISGHRMYAGEARRPNMLTYIFTGNSLRLSRDIAERCFIIRLARPVPESNWREEVFDYIRTNRDRIVTDGIALLRSAPQGSAEDRWQAWADNVLARCTPHPEPVVQANQARREECDEEMEEAKMIYAALQHYGDRETGQHTLFLENTVMTELVNKTLNTKFTTRRVCSMVDGHISAGRLPKVTKVRTKSSRGYQLSDGG
jgi:hypothetical protein